MFNMDDPDYSVRIFPEFLVRKNFSEDFSLEVENLGTYENETVIESIRCDLMRRTLYILTKAVQLGYIKDPGLNIYRDAIELKKKFISRGFVDSELIQKYRGLLLGEISHWRAKPTSFEVSMFRYSVKIFTMSFIDISNYHNDRKKRLVFDIFESHRRTVKMFVFTAHIKDDFKFQIEEDCRNTVEWIQKRLKWLHNIYKFSGERMSYLIYEDTFHEPKDVQIQYGLEEKFTF